MIPSRSSTPSSSSLVDMVTVWVVAQLSVVNSMVSGAKVKSASSGGLRVTVTVETGWASRTTV